MVKYLFLIFFFYHDSKEHVPGGNANHSPFCLCSLCTRCNACSSCWDPWNMATMVSSFGLPVCSVLSRAWTDVWLNPILNVLVPSCFKMYTCGLTHEMESQNSDLSLTSTGAGRCGAPEPNCWLSAACMLELSATKRYPWRRSANGAWCARLNRGFGESPLFDTTVHFLLERWNGTLGILQSIKSRERKSLTILFFISNEGPWQHVVVPCFFFTNRFTSGLRAS